MSVASTKNPPVLRSFINSDIFDSNLLSRSIAELAGDRATAVFFNSTKFHPDFQGLPQLRSAHKEFAQESADRTMTKVKTKAQASLALKKAVDECNPILLDALISLGPRKFEDSYNLLSALYSFANRGDFHSLKRMYGRLKISDSAHQEVMEKVVARGDVVATEWLLDNHSIPPSMGKVLGAAFKCQGWERMVLLVYPKIPLSQMKQALFEGAANILTEGVPQKLDFFLQHTEARNHLGEEDWEKIVGNSKTRDMVLFIMDSNNQIPVSTLGFYSITNSCRRNKLWDVLESILSSDRAQRDREFLKNICLQDDNDGVFYNILDKEFHLFQNNCIFQDDWAASWMLGGAIKWKCFNILRIFIESPNAIKHNYLIHWGWIGGSGYKKYYTVPNRILLQISDVVGNAGYLALKSRVDHEITRRKRLTTKIAIKLQELFGPKDNIKGNYIGGPPCLDD